MTKDSANLRKAAVLIRSLDGETAAKVLTQLSTEEAAAIRDAIRSLGTIDVNEQAEVIAELRRGKVDVARHTDHGVELNLSSISSEEFSGKTSPEPSTSKRFEFLESAPVDTVAACLSREHAQTAAVVLSYVAPSRAAALLAAMPAKRQAETMERLSRLGETDPESVSVVERELAAWAARQPIPPRKMANSNDTLHNILTAADESTRQTILANLHLHNDRLAAHLRAPVADAPKSEPALKAPIVPPAPPALSRATVPPARRAAPIAMKFDDLIHLSDTFLNRLLHDIDPNLLVLALVGSSEKLIDRIASRLPRQQAKTFRRQLQHIGPTRLSDVESAQRAVVEVVGRELAPQYS